MLVGLAETHGREETEALLQGLEILPRKAIEHRGIKLQEFDLDGALARKPSLILVDELAHTNAPGCRHAKRWQDVKELLDRGFDVYSTLNVQHLESLNDVVAQITGVTVQETVPDSVLERADVELVDLPPEELLERLREGKVYIPEQAARAVESFFKLSNLNALRELSLRATAEGVGAIVEEQRRRQAPGAIWPTAERLLVCVGPGPNSAKLVRAAKRMAAGLRAQWLAVFVESQRQALSEAARAGAIENLRLAERLGAETLTLSSRDVVEGTLDLARQRNVTKIIVGKTGRPRWLRLPDRQHRRRIDTPQRRDRRLRDPRRAGRRRRPPRASWLPSSPRPRNTPSPPSRSRACTAVCASRMFPFVSLANLVMVYLLGTLLVAARGHRGPAVLSAALGVLAFDFCFVPPRFSFSVSDTQYLLTFLVMFVAAVDHQPADRAHAGPGRDGQARRDAHGHDARPEPPARQHPRHGRHPGGGRAPRGAGLRQRHHRPDAGSGRPAGGEGRLGSQAGSGREGAQRGAMGLRPRPVGGPGHADPAGRGRALRPAHRRGRLRWGSCACSPACASGS